MRSGGSWGDQQRGQLVGPVRGDRRAEVGEEQRALLVRMARLGAFGLRPPARDLHRARRCRRRIRRRGFGRVLGVLVELGAEGGHLLAQRQQREDEGAHPCRSGAPSLRAKFRRAQWLVHSVSMRQNGVVVNMSATPRYHPPRRRQERMPKRCRRRSCAPGWLTLARCKVTSCRSHTKPRRCGWPWR